MFNTTLPLRAAKRGAIQSASRRTVAANEEDGGKDGGREEVEVFINWISMDASIRPYSGSRACHRQTRHFWGVCKRREAAACLRAEGEEEGRMLGRGEPTLSPPRFPLHQCTWMKGNAATLNRLVRCSPTNPGKRGGKKIKNQVQKKEKKNRDTRCC